MEELLVSDDQENKTSGYKSSGILLQALGLGGGFVFLIFFTGDYLDFNPLMQAGTVLAIVYYYGAWLYPSILTIGVTILTTILFAYPLAFELITMQLFSNDNSWKLFVLWHFIVVLAGIVMSIMLIFRRKHIATGIAKQAIPTV